MSARIRIKIMGGTEIKEAYQDCETVSIAIGGMSVETVFNGLRMLYYRQPLKEWKDKYYNEKFMRANKGDEW